MSQDPLPIPDPPQVDVTVEGDVTEEVAGGGGGGEEEEGDGGAEPVNAEGEPQDARGSRSIDRGDGVNFQFNLERLELEKYNNFDESTDDGDRYQDYDSHDQDTHSDDYWHFIAENWGWYDDDGYWRSTHDYGYGFAAEADGEDRTLEDALDDGLDDTIRNSFDDDEDEEDEDEEVEEEEEEKEFDFRRKRPQKKVSDPVEVSKPTMRWFARKMLQDHIPKSDENLRRKRLLEKCQLVRKVSKPIVTLFGGKTKQKVDKVGDKEPAPDVSDPSRDRDEKEKRPSGRESKQSVYEETETEQQTTGDLTLREFSGKEWAVKNTIEFLSKEGCSSSSGKSYSSPLKSVREEGGDFRLELYEKQLQRRRGGIGHHEQAPEITDAMKRHAERAVWRAIIDNTKPRYPLPRFILPRHRYLKKVQSQFIGPGSYEHDVYEAQMKLRRMRLPSTWATCTARFPKDKTEGKNAAEAPVILDPWTNLDKANYKKKNPGMFVPFGSSQYCR